MTSSPAAAALQRARDALADPPPPVLVAPPDAAAPVERWTPRAPPRADTGTAWVHRLPVVDPPPRSGGVRGLAVCVKDLIDVAGAPTRAGSADWSILPDRDADAVAALRAAGAVIAGKGHTNEFAYGIDGANPFWPAPGNPWDPARLAGGSSSGPAVAVAAGACAIGLGTDTSGSIRVPASLCGLAGLRPSLGAVSAAGVVPLVPGMDVVGPLARDVVTLAEAAAVLAGWREVPRPAALPGTRIGLVAAGPATLGRAASGGPSTRGRAAPGGPSARGPAEPGGPCTGGPRATPAARGAVALAAAALERAGTAVVPVAVPGWGAAIAAQRILQYHGAAAAHAALRPPVTTYSAPVADRLAVGRTITAGLRDEAARVASRFRDGLEAFLAAHALDVLLLPAACDVAPPATADTIELDGTAVPLREALLEATAPITLLGGPAAVVPTARHAGLPLGVQLAGRRGDDARLVGFALALESALAH